MLTLENELRLLYLELLPPRYSLVKLDNIFRIAVKYLGFEGR